MNEYENLDARGFAELGGGRIAFVKEVLSEDLPRYFPQAPQLAPGMKLFALLDAAGTPLMVADNRDAIEMNAREHDLETVSVH